ncbi:MAG TPA: glycosyltransferase, partial [Armatimonadota bacterium]|nr:glycosyltransferase [Armatimonadota bacterium]
MTIKVLHILPDFASAGAERMAVNLMTTLDHNTFNVAGISLFDRIGSELEAVLDSNNIPVWYLGKRPGPDLRMFHRIANVIREFQPDIVHTHRYVLRYSLLPVINNHVLGRVHTIHSVAKKDVTRMGRIINQFAFSMGFLPVTMSRVVRESMPEVYNTKRIKEVSYGIDLSKFRKPNISRETWRSREEFRENDFLFIHIGRFTAAKNHETLLKAFSQVVAINPQAHLLLVGT